MAVKALPQHPQKLVTPIDPSARRSLFVYTGWMQFPPGGRGAGGDLAREDIEFQVPDSGEFNNGWPSGMTVVASPSSFSSNNDSVVALDDAAVAAEFPFGLTIRGKIAVKNATIFTIAYQVTAWLERPN